MSPAKSIIICMTVFSLILGGCTHNIAVTSNSQHEFCPRNVIIPLTVGVLVEDSAKNYIYSYKKGMSDRLNFLLGVELEKNAITSLSKVFKKVQPIKSANVTPENVERIIKLDFSDETTWDWKMTGLSLNLDNSATVGLSCEVSDASGKILWKTTSIGKVEKNAMSDLLLKAAYSSALSGAEENRRAFGATMYEALVFALEDLNNKLVDSGKNNIIQ